MIKEQEKVAAKIKSSVFIKIFLLFLLFFFSIGCRQGKGRSETLTIAGSTTILPIVQATGEEFEERFPGTRVMVQGGGSSAGVEAVATGAADIGTCSRELTAEEVELGLKDFIIAIDAIVVIVNPQNPVENLSQQQLENIFSGNITSWHQVGGKKEPIILVNRDEASGTREAFSKVVLSKKDFTKDAVIQPGSGQVRAIVAGTPGAIGYISLGYVTDEVKIVGYNGIKPTLDNIKTGEYKLQRRLHLLTKEKYSEIAQKFIDFIFSSEIQKKIISVEFVPVK